MLAAHRATRILCAEARRPPRVRHVQPEMRTAFYTRKKKRHQNDKLLALNAQSKHIGGCLQNLQTSAAAN